MAPGTQGLRQSPEAAGRVLRQGGGGLAGTKALGIGEGPLEQAPLGRVAQVLQGEDMDIRHRAGEGGVDDDGLDVRDDQERRVLQGRGVDLKLLEGDLEILALALVLPAVAAAPPDVRPALPSPGLGGALLEAVPGTDRVRLRRCWLIQQPAEVDEVLLRGGALLEGRVPPLGDKLVWGHGACLSRLA
jgi:hypothetical protein